MSGGRWRMARAGLVLLSLFALLAACGSETDEPSWWGYVEGPNEGIGWVSINEPLGTPPDGRVETTEASIYMDGNTFVSPQASCPALIGDLGPGYTVTWSNAANGSSGLAHAELNCFLIVFAWWRIDLGLIPLELGDNPITVTASDGIGNVGRASLLVVRLIPPP